MKRKRKETVKSVVLGILVLMSLTLSYLIITYQPDYEIFTKRSTQKSVESDKNSLLNFLIPDSVVKNYEGSREEPIVQNSITKVATVDAVKNKQVQKNLLSIISDSESTEARVRNRNIEDITTNNVEKIMINYQVTLDSALVKPLFFSEENSNISLEFDTIVLLKERPNMIYLYKKDDKNYLQITVKEKVYDTVEAIFNENKHEYGKYSLNNKFIYVKEKIDNLMIDEYSIEDVNMNKLARGIFDKKDNIRVSSNNEMTDGYGILKPQGNRIIYTNPSSEDGKEVDATTAVTNAINFLELGYNEDVSYQVTTALEGITILQQTYKDSIVFSKDGSAEITVEDNTNGIYRLTSPRRISKAYLSSKPLGTYDIERKEYVINYLYKHVELQSVDDIVLGYEKSYNKSKNTCSYVPAWYIKYNDRYVSFKSLKEAVDKGERL
mgnify:CR=1 FL=1